MHFNTVDMISVYKILLIFHMFRNIGKFHVMYFFYQFHYCPQFHHFNKSISNFIIICIPLLPGHISLLFLVYLNTTFNMMSIKNHV